LQFGEFRNLHDRKELEMLRSRIWRYLLLLATLFGIAGCTKTNNRTPPYPYKNEAKANTVIIDHCVATPDLVTVRENDALHWEVAKNDPETYTVAFTTRNVIHEAPPVVSLKSPDKIHKVSNGCNTATPGSCDKFPYLLLTSSGADPCPDPGVHVVP
jgi:hypothetical protein